MSKTDWRTEITEALTANQESWENVQSCTLSEEELDKKFDSGFGTSEGQAFTVWTKDYVYFPVVYDGAEWADFVDRNPNGKPTKHKGGQ